MAKVSTERISRDIVKDRLLSEEDILDFKYDIYVGKDGLFSATLPPLIVIKFEKAKIDFSKNRMGNPGYFCDKNFDKLIEKIKDVCKEYYSRKKISQTIVIRYVIKTTCTYCLDIDGNIVPNAREEWTRIKERPADDWRNGTETQHATSPLPFGMEVYAKPHYKREYKYKSGVVKTEYEEITAFDGDAGDKTKQYYLHYLQSVCSMAKPNGGSLQEIAYTEASAKFFVDMIKGICLINEKVKQFAEPENILSFLKKGGALQLEEANKLKS